MADAAADMGALSSVKVTVDKVSVHSESKGWVDLSTSPTTYDLLQLKASGENALLADAQLDPGTYQQMRLHISKVIVTDASGDHEAKLPSGELKIVGGLTVEPNSTSTATFDFIADESLHVTGNGQYILAPVIQVETRDDADVEVESGGRVRVTGGQLRTNTKVGMDIGGNVGVGLGIPADANLTIAGGVVVVGPGAAGGKGNLVVGIKDVAANMGSVTSVKMTVQAVSVQSKTKGWMEVSMTPKTYDLLELRSKGYTAVFADAELPSDEYNQIRFDISKVVVRDASGDHEAKLPSGELKIVGDISTAADSTSTAVFDFDANESIHLATDGKYVFAPVVHLETRDQADASVDASSRLSVSGGKVRTSVKVGMNEKGMVGVGLRIPNGPLTIGADGKISVGVAGGSGTILDVGGSIGAH